MPAYSSHPSLTVHESNRLATARVAKVLRYFRQENPVRTTAVQLKLRNTDRFLILDHSSDVPRIPQMERWSERRDSGSDVTDPCTILPYIGKVARLILVANRCVFRSLFCDLLQLRAPSDRILCRRGFSFDVRNVVYVRPVSAWLILLCVESCCMVNGCFNVVPKLFPYMLSPKCFASLPPPLPAKIHY